MKKLICLAAVLVLLSSVGCANGPVRQWLRGSACNSCQPPFQPSTGTPIGTCTDGCGTHSAIPNPIIQPNPGQATISGNITGTTPTGQTYYSNNDPTTQGYGIQPAIGNGLNPPAGGPIPQANGF